MQNWRRNELNTPISSRQESCPKMEGAEQHVENTMPQTKSVWAKNRENLHIKTITSHSNKIIFSGFFCNVEAQILSNLFDAPKRCQELDQDSSATYHPFHASPNLMRFLLWVQYICVIAPANFRALILIGSRDIHQAISVGSARFTAGMPIREYF